MKLKKAAYELDRGLPWTGTVSFSTVLKEHWMAPSEI